METDFLITKIRRVVFVGESEYPEKITRFKNDFIYNELIFYLSGDSTVSYNGVEMKCDEDCIRFMPKSVNNEYTVTRRTPCSVIFFEFDSDRPINDIAFTQKFVNNQKLRELFKKAFAIWSAKNEGYYFECLSILYKIFSEMQKTTYLPEKKYTLIKPAVDCIREKFLIDEFDGKELANLCGISYSYLTKLFIKRFGIPPKKYIIRLKINYACDLLKSEEYTISQIAEMCGYNDVYFFSRQFKEYMGISPTAFLKKYKSSK